MGYFSHWYDYAMPLIPGNQYLYDQGKSLLSGNGVSTPGLGDLKNTLEGDPAGYAKALQGLQGQANQQAEKVKNFLLGREQLAQQTYRPMQQLFSNMYGTGGMAPAKAPGVPGSGSVL
jgi:hypothetical protein